VEVWDSDSWGGVSGRRSLPKLGQQSQDPTAEPMGGDPHRWRAIIRWRRRADEGLLCKKRPAADSMHMI
jgi:hypothetical protein